MLSAMMASLSEVSETITMFRSVSIPTIANMSGVT